MKAKSHALSLFFGGLVPVVLFTVIEEKYGTLNGLIAGMIFGLGEIIFELHRYKKVNAITWISNGLLLTLGGISLMTQDGFWFKMQSAIFEFFFFGLLFISWSLKKPFLVTMSEKQNTGLPESVKSHFAHMTLRLSIFFLVHAVLAVYAAFYWTSEAWAMLKGLGLTVSLVLYMLAEGLWLRRSLKPKN